MSILRVNEVDLNDAGNASIQIANTWNVALVAGSVIRLEARNDGSVVVPGGISIGTNVSNTSAILDVTSTTKGFLPPRMTTAQRDAISAPSDGLILYNSSTNKLQVRAAGSWVDLH